MFACFFETNFPNIPFFKSRLLSFLVVVFVSAVVFAFVFMVYVSAFLFLCWLCFGNFLALFFYLSCFLFCFQSMKKTVFSLQFWCFFEAKLVKM